MTAPIARKNDPTTGGGKVITTASKVYSDGILVGVHTADITPHKGFPIPKHAKAKTTEGSPKVFAEGKPVLRVNTPLTCGHKISAGSPKTQVP